MSGRSLGALPLLIAALLCGAVLLVGASASSGAPKMPGGPRLAVVVSRAGDAAAKEVVTIGPDGEDLRSLARGTIGEPIAFFERPNWSPDGHLLAFESQGKETPAVAVMRADGSNLHLLHASEHPGGPDDVTFPEPLFDPKTGEIVIGVLHLPDGESPFGDARPTGGGHLFRSELWTVPVDGGKPRRLSSRPLGKGPGFVYPSSVASNGEVAATALKRSFSVVVFNPHGGPVKPVVPSTTQEEGTLEPAISPDGKEIVYKVDEQKEVDNRRTLIATDLMIVPTAGGKPTLLARVKGGARWPSWDPSGSRIAFTALNAAGSEDAPSGEPGDSLMEINPDGSCLTKVFSVGKRGEVEGAAWEPGAERGIGPISC